MPTLLLRRATALAAVLATSLAAAAGSAGAAGIDWKPCGKSFECARLVVPVDYAKPQGRKLALALIRLPAGRATDRIGSLVVNPGGPGVSGVEWVRGSSGKLTSALRARFDVVSFDPRGVGRSAAVVCRTDAQRDLEMTRAVLPRTEAERATAVADAKRLAQGCARSASRLLPHLTTEATARDLDRLRGALGDAKLTYIGFSYGTVLGATYASLFAGRVRALALDGAADPEVWTGDAAAFLRAQAVGVHREYLAFLAWCSAHASECAFARDGDPGAAITQLAARLRANPVLVRSARRLLTERLAVTAVIAALYSASAWPLLGSVEVDELAGDGGSVLLYLADAYNDRQADGTYSSLQDAYTAISCVDHAPASRKLATYARLAAEFARISPLDGGLLGYEQLPCAFWPVKAASRFTGPFDAAGAPPILVIGTTGDPATPYVWAKALAAQLDSGVLLTRVGDGHTAYGASACVRRLVDEYLLALSPPRNRTVCDS